MKKKLLPVQKNHLIYFVVGILVAVCSAIFIYYSVSNNYLINFNPKRLKNFAKSLATIAEIGFFLAIGLFLLRFIMKNLNQKGVNILDKVLNKVHIDIPKEWLKIITKPDGTRKKVVLYNISISNVLRYDERILLKIRNSLKIFKSLMFNLSYCFFKRP